MKGRKPNAEEKRFMDRMCSLGCVVCLKFHGVESPCSFHHMDGRTKPGAHYHGIGLCGNHHQVADTQKPKRWVSRHGDGKFEFEEAYESEMDLYHYALELMGE